MILSARRMVNDVDERIPNYCDVKRRTLATGMPRETAAVWRSVIYCGVSMRHYKALISEKQHTFR